MKNFAGIPDKYARYKDAAILLQPIPYDGTSTWGKGADKGFMAFLEASENMETYDIETGIEVYREGIHILPELNGFNSPEEMYKHVHQKTKDLLKENKFLTFFGGEHSISIGIIKAFYQNFRELTVLQLDAHLDLRPSYLGSKFNHACALHDASKNTNLIQVGIRSMDGNEAKYMDPAKCFFAKTMYQSANWIQKSIGLMSDKVYITLDLDVLDSSIMPSTGTPEPGGLDWFTLINYLKEVFFEKEVVGFDIVELAPISGLKAPNYLAAKLYNKMLSYKFSDYGK